MKFSEMSKEQREENINIAIDEFKEFIVKMAIDLGHNEEIVKNFISNITWQEYKRFSEELADQLGLREELHEMTEYISIASSIHESLCREEGVDNI